jgi:hypothetical protein
MLFSLTGVSLQYKIPALIGNPADKELDGRKANHA